jgi:hypothetical protein
MPSQSTKGTSVANFTPPEFCASAFVTDSVRSAAMKQKDSSIRRMSMSVPLGQESGFVAIRSVTVRFGNR